MRYNNESYYGMRPFSLVRGQNEYLYYVLIIISTVEHERISALLLLCYICRYGRFKSKMSHLKFDLAYL